MRQLSRRSRVRTAAALIGVALLGGPALGQTVYNETEANDTKAAANGPFLMTAGDSIVGLTTGSSTITPGNGSADYFLVQTAAAPAGVYQHRLVITTPGTAGHIGTIRGLTQTAGVPNPGTDAVVQTSSTVTTPPRYVQWYGFGAGESIYFRVTGTASTASNYTATLETVPVSAIDIGTFFNGNITIDRPAGITTDTDFWVYDSNFNAIATYGNDDPNTLTRNYTPGTYYIGYTNFNFANEQPAAFDDTFQTGIVLDFAAAANSSTTLLPSLAIQLTDAFNQVSVPTPKNTQFDVVWLRFMVNDTPPAMGACCLPDGTCQQLTSVACTTQEGVYGGDNVACMDVVCAQPGACCLPLFQCTILSAGQCATAGGTYMGDSSLCGTCPPPPPGVFPEMEPNDDKEGANGIFVMANGNTIVGMTTGSSTTVPGPASSDNFIVRTPAAALGVYRHRLIVTTDGTAGHTLTIRGLTQTGGVINFGTDAVVQTSSTATTPPRYIQWYGFGKEEQIYARITGTTSTTSPYTITLETTPIGTTSLGTYFNGDITIDRPTGITTDTDFWVYDANFNAIATYGNDDPNTLTRNYTPGTYYIGYTNFNFANDQSAAFDDTFQTGIVLDFANAAANSSTTLLPSLGIRLTDAFDVVSTPTPKDTQFDIVWLTFTVGITPPTTGACCLPDGTCVQATSNGCAGQNGTYAGDNVACVDANCPSGACCLADGTCVISGPVGCAGLGGTYAGNGVACLDANCPQPGACCMGDLTCSILSAAQCANAGGLYMGNGTACGACPAPPPGSVAILGADSAANVADVVSKLAGTDLFPFIGTLNVMTATPTLADLQQFDAVMVFSNLSFQSSDALGNVLADYVDAGGGVVVTMFTLSTNTTNRFLTGRWDATYQIVPQNSGNFTGAGAGIGTILVPGHPILDGVNTFLGGNSGYRPTTTALNGHGVKVAEWTDGKTLIAVSSTLDKRVDLGMFPPSSTLGVANWDVTTDGARLMANALLYAIGACPVDWNGDNMVNSSDISAFLTTWIASVNNMDLTGDFNGDMVTNSTDISAFLTAWIDAVTNGC